MKIFAKHYRKRLQKNLLISLCFILTIGTMGSILNGGAIQAASGDIIYVNETATGSNDGSSWNNAFTNLQDGLDAASAGDEIWISEGTYYPSKDIGGNNNPSDPRMKTFQMKNGVEIYGGFPNSGNPVKADRNTNTYETILSGDLDQDGSLSNLDAYHVILNPTLDNTAVLNGVTIQGGNASATSGRESSGGGMYNIFSSPTLENVTIRNNYATNYGGGMFNSGPAGTLSSSSPNLNYVTIQDNEAGQDGGGVYNASENSLVVTNSTINNNTASNYGGGIFEKSGTSTYTDGTISGNTADWGGGVYFSQSTPTLNNIQLENNDAAKDGGGIRLASSKATLIDVFISGNTAGQHGGGIYTYKEDSTLTNVEITNNTATNYGGGIYIYTAAPIISNGKITGNKSSSGGGIYNKEGNPSIINGTISGNVAGSGGGFSIQSANMTVINSIIWGNEVTGTGNANINLLGINPSPSLTFKSSLIEGSGGSGNWDSSYGTDGGDNLASDPEFVAPESASNAPTASGDYQLQSSSPAINAADNGSVQAGVLTDLNGNTRIIGSSVDMGVYEANAVAGGDVTAIYVDEDGNEIAPPEVVSGNVGESYNTNGKSIPGYTLTATPSNAAGTFTSEAQEVKYVYTKDAVAGENVVVMYVDEEGNEIASPEFHTGNVGDSYMTQTKEIDGYTLKETPTNASGTFGSTRITVTYVYKIDQEPNEISDTDVEEPTNQPNKDSTNNETDEEEDSVVTIKEADKENALPKTSTSIYNWLFAGAILLISGLIFIMIYRRRSQAS
ncbi:MucBP domain-containing protein [Virgibacillus sp. W0430]|uniref:MucBP domain-containing protein n=1 Tax=Virgibacillus sp. W0430 TaxID=3391580 RepID=UPI003F472D35